MSAIVIEQTPDESKRAFEVHQNAALSSIRLSRAAVTSQPIDEASKTPISVIFSFKSKPLSAPSDLLRIEIAFRMAGIEGGPDGQTKAVKKKPQPVISVECAYEVDYALREGFEITPEHVKAFREGTPFLTCGRSSESTCRTIFRGWACLLSRRLSCACNPNRSPTFGLNEILRSKVVIEYCGALC